MEGKDVQIYQYDRDQLKIQFLGLDEVVNNLFVENLPDKQVTWLNFHNLEDRKSIEQFCKAQYYDTLVISDIYQMDSRPKLEDYGSYYYFSIPSAVPSEVNGNKLIFDQISFILGENYLISFQTKSNDHFTSVRDRIENRKGIVRERQADFLLYRLLDAIIDNYFAVIDSVEKNIEYLETLVNNKYHHSLPQRIEIQKKRLSSLRKMAAPLKELAVNIENSNSKLLNSKNRHYFVDFKNNCLSILEEIEYNRITLEGVSNLYYAIQGQRMNQIMKLLTIVSTIFIPLTFIVGVYGMNFHHMPELSLKYGYFICWGMMVAIAVALIFYFYKKGWLNKNDF